MRQQSEQLIKILKCPVCGASMASNGTSLLCDGEKRHCFDFAASGYVNLSSPTQSGGGDSKAAVRARSDFLNLGYYAPVAKRLAVVCREHSKDGRILVDAGCGEGYYGEFLAGAGFSVFGADLSKFAADAASKRLAIKGKEDFLFSVASVFDLPLKDSSADVLVNVFAPCAESEYARVLKHGGVLCIAHAGERHLWGLKEAVYDNAHENTARADLPNSMRKICDERVYYTVNIEGEAQIKSLFAMTPYYWRTSPDDMKKLDGMKSLATEVEVIISVYQNGTCEDDT